MKIFTKNKIYSLSEIIDICDKNGLVTVDCQKDENMISVEKWNNGEGEDCLFEFLRVADDLFRATWLENDIMLEPGGVRRPTSKIF